MLIDCVLENICMEAVLASAPFPRSVTVHPAFAKASESAFSCAPRVMPASNASAMNDSLIITFPCVVSKI